MIDQYTYETLSRAFLSPPVLAIVRKYYSSYDSLISAAQEKFNELRDKPFAENIIAELYAFYDYIKDYQPEIEDKWDNGEDDLLDEDIDEEENVEEREEERPSWIEARRQLIEKWKAENEERKQKKQELVESVKKELKTILRNAGEPLALEDIVSRYNSLNPDAHIKDSIIRNCLHDTKVFINVGRKSLFALKNKANKNIFKGSLYDAVIKVLHSKSMPFLMDELVEGVLKLRPDSNQKSARSIITSMLKSHRVFMYNDKYIGLDTIKYHRSFKKTVYEARETFDDKLKRLMAFIRENNRLPFTNGPQEETSIAVWFNRITQSTSLTTEQMVAIYNLKKEIDATDMPQNVEQFTFRQNCSDYKAVVMRTGKLVPYSRTDSLYRWFTKYCAEYSSLKDVRKVYFDDLVAFLSNFGYELNLR